MRLQPSSSDQSQYAGQNVVAVDLDRTLVRSDTLEDMFAITALKQPFTLLVFLFRFFLTGPAAAKAYLAEKGPGIRADVLPYREEVLARARAEADQGKTLILCSASHESTVRAVFEHLGIFDAYMCSDKSQNLKGRKKAEALKALNAKSLTYIGDSPADLAVWAEADHAIGAGPAARITAFERKLKKPIDLIETHRKPVLGQAVKLFRLHQWSKNFLVFAPLFLAQNITIHSLALASIAFVLMGIMASSTYVINDIMDIDADRAHEEKKNRPLASGTLDPVICLLVSVGSILGVLVIAMLWNPGFMLALLGYLVITFSYSLRLKKIILLDVLIIGVLFTMRLVAGGLATGNLVSNWLLSFSMFFFPSLGLAKRQGELVRAALSGETSRLIGRGYRVDDKELTLSFGISASMASLLVLLIYISGEAFAEEGLYSNPDMLWVLPALIAVWLGRIWVLAHRGILRHEPVAFAIKDKVSLGLAGILVIVFAIASALPPDSFERLLTLLSG